MPKADNSEHVSSKVINRKLNFVIFLLFLLLLLSVGKILLDLGVL